MSERLGRLSAAGSLPVDDLEGQWTTGMAAPAATDRVWLHGDLHPGNVVVRKGGLVGLIDWGDMTGGDPATDLAAAWTLLRSDAERQAFWGRYGIRAW